MTMTHLSVAQNDKYSVRSRYAYSSSTMELSVATTIITALFRLSINKRTVCTCENTLQEFYGFPTKYLVGIVSIFVGNVTFPTTVPTNCFVGIKVTIPTTFPTKLVGKVFVSVAT
jgi:hypothetical protein